MKLAAECVLDLAKAGTPLDASVVDGLWAGFAKYRPSRTNSIRGTQALHDAVLAVKDPSYGEKAMAMLVADVPSEDASDRRPVNDELEFWQTTAIQVIKALEYKRAARALVTVLVTRSKIALAALAQSALMHMPLDAEPLLVLALKGSDPELAKLDSDWPDKGYVPIVLNVLSYLSIDAARDATLAFVPQLDNDMNREAAAMSLLWFAPSPSVVPTFKRIYDKLPPIAAKGDVDAGVERAQLLGVASEFFDPALGPWALAQSSNATGSNMLEAKVGAIQSAIKLMRPADKPLVARAIASLGAGLSEREKQMVAGNVDVAFKNASAALDKCAMNASCYVQILDEPMQTSSNDWKAIKAAHMAGMIGSDQTRKELVARIGKVTNPGARIAVAVAINHLAPKGDMSDADALEKIGNDTLTKVALMLRARASR